MGESGTFGDARDYKESETVAVNGGFVVTEDTVDSTGDEVNAGHLRAFVERIERLEEEKAAIAQDIKDVYGEAKANGFDTPIIRKVVALRKIDRDSRIEAETILDLYLTALDMN